MSKRITSGIVAVVPILALFAVAATGDDEFQLIDILWYVLIGVVVGPIARLLVPGDDPMSVLQTILVGIGGALIGGVLVGLILPNTTGVDWIAAIIGGVLLVIVVRAIRRNSGRSLTV